MRVIPAIDLRGGACVQLVGGEYDAERVRRDDPVAVAQEWRDAGFRELHVVDLDAATGRGDNWDVIPRLIGAGLPVQLGGGLRDDASIARALDAGAARAVVGTQAFADPAWLAAAAARWPGRLVVAADVRGRAVLARGWQQALPLDIHQALAALAPLPLAGVLVTAVHVEGQLAGPDVELFQDIRSLTQQHLIASGGITTMEDLHALDALGIDACVLGMTLYTGRIDARAAAGYSQ